MNFKNIIVISCDIEGTIVDNTRNIREAAVNTINRLRAAGYTYGS